MFYLRARLIPGLIFVREWCSRSRKRAQRRFGANIDKVLILSPFDRTARADSSSGVLWQRASSTVVCVEAEVVLDAVRLQMKPVTFFECWPPRRPPLRCAIPVSRCRRSRENEVTGRKDLSSLGKSKASRDVNSDIPSTVPQTLPVSRDLSPRHFRCQAEMQRGIGEETTAVATRK